MQGRLQVNVHRVTVIAHASAPGIVKTQGCWLPRRNCFTAPKSSAAPSGTTTSTSPGVRSGTSVITAPSASTPSARVPSEQTVRSCGNGTASQTSRRDGLRADTLRLRSAAICGPRASHTSRESSGCAGDHHPSQLPSIRCASVLGQAGPSTGRQGAHTGRTRRFALLAMITGPRPGPLRKLRIGRATMTTPSPRSVRNSPRGTREAVRCAESISPCRAS